MTPARWEKVKAEGARSTKAPEGAGLSWNARKAEALKGIISRKGSELL